MCMCVYICVCVYPDDISELYLYLLFFCHFFCRVVYDLYFFLNHFLFSFSALKWKSKLNERGSGRGIGECVSGKEVYGNSRSKRLIDRLLNGSQKGARVNQPAKQNRNQTSFLLSYDNNKRERRLIIFSCFI